MRFRLSGRAVLASLLATFVLPSQTAQNCCQYQPYSNNYQCKDVDDSTLQASGQTGDQYCFANRPAGQYSDSRFNPNAYCSQGSCVFYPDPPSPSPSPPPPPSPPVSMLQGDPVLTGFNNETFEFFGSAGYNYSLLAHPTLTLNMQLVPAGPDHVRHQGGEGTFAAGIAVVLPSLELVAHVDQPGNMTLSVNGIDADIENPADLLGGQLLYEPYEPGLGQTITLRHPPFHIKLVAVKSYTDSTSGYNRGHFDLRVELTNLPSASLGGVLGETLGKQTGVDGLSAESTFEVPSLTHPAGILGQTSESSRRLLKVRQAEPVSFPLVAGLRGSLTADA